MMPDSDSAASIIRRYLKKDSLVMVGDGVGAPLGLREPLAAAARDVGGVRLLLGWCLQPPVDLDDEAAFPAVKAFMGGYALRAGIDSGRIGYLPVKFGAVPALLHHVRPDIVLATVVPCPGGFTLGCEVGWLPAVLDRTVTVLAEVNSSLPRAAANVVLPSDRVIIVSETDRAAIELPDDPPNDVSTQIGKNVAAFIAEGSVIQFGPGSVGRAALSAVDVPVGVDSGIIADGVVDLDERGLLVGDPIGAYLIGTTRLYRWAHDRSILHRLEFTHDTRRLSERPLVAINTALEIDHFGSVNVERTRSSAVAGIGGHGDYALAATRARHGISIVALPSARNGRSTLVDRLSAPVSTSYADIEVIVNEFGAADLRGCTVQERVELIEDLWSRSGLG